MIDRLVHGAEIVSLNGDSYRMKGKDLSVGRSRSASNDASEGDDSSVLHERAGIAPKERIRRLYKLATISLTGERRSRRMQEHCIPVPIGIVGFRVIDCVEGDLGLEVDIFRRGRRTVA